jgi:hypothetical protein
MQKERKWRQRHTAATRDGRPQLKAPLNVQDRVWLNAPVPVELCDAALDRLVDVRDLLLHQRPLCRISKIRVRREALVDRLGASRTSKGRARLPAQQTTLFCERDPEPGANASRARNEGITSQRAKRAESRYKALTDVVERLHHLVVHLDDQLQVADLHEGVEPLER